MKARQIDHIVLAVPNLEQATRDFKDKYNLELVYGGKHESFGTHNALLNLGNGCYLEVLAPDLDNTTYQGKRWMGADLSQKPVVCRWALKSNDLTKDQKALQKINPEYGSIIEGSRQKTDGSTLRWQMIRPLSSPLVDIAPFMVDWKDSDSHPTDSLPEECQLVSIEFADPKVEQMQGLFNELGLDDLVHSEDEPRISIRLQTNNGTVMF